MSFFRPLSIASFALLLPLSAQALEVRSDTKDFLAQAVTEIGYNPSTVSEENACFPASDDFSESGKIVAEHDWIITSEIEAGGLEYVAFAGLAEEGPNGACNFSDGFVSVYRDGAFVALIENANTDNQLLAVIRSAEDGAIDILPSNSATPVGRIRYDAAGDQLLVTAP